MGFSQMDFRLEILFANEIRKYNIFFLLRLIYVEHSQWGSGVEILMAKYSKKYKYSRCFLSLGKLYF